MAADRVIDPETALAAQNALISALADLLETAIDACAKRDAIERAATIADLCNDAAALCRAITVIRDRSAP